MKHTSTSLSIILSVLTIWGAHTALAGDEENPDSYKVLSARVAQCPTLAAIPDADRENINAAAEKLITEDMNGDSIITIIGALAAAPDAYRDRFVAAAQSLITKDSLGYNILDIITALAAVPDADRDNFVAAAQNIITERMSGDSINNIITTLSSVPADGRDSVIAAAQSLITENMEWYIISAIIKALAEVPDADRHSVSAMAERLIVEGMGQYTISVIIKALAEVPDADRHSFVRGCNSLIPTRALMHDCEQIIYHILQYASPQDIDAYFQRIITQLAQDMDAHDMGEGERFSRTIQLIENPDASFSRRNLRITGQEALTAAREPIYSGYRSLCANDGTATLMEQALPSVGDTPGAFEVMVRDMSQVLRGKDFRAQTALTGLERLSGTGAYQNGGVSENFVPYERQCLPTIRQLAVQLHGLCKTTPLYGLIRNNIVVHFGALHNTLPQTMGHYPGAGAFMLQNTQLVNALVQMVQGEADTLPVTEKPAQNFARLVRTLRMQSLRDQFNPLIEALFMSMRGHNKDLMNPDERNNQACTDGVYLNLMREMGGLPALDGVGADMHAVTAVPCDG